jgi:hypothetical protein
MGRDFFAREIARHLAHRDLILVQSEVHSFSAFPCAV